jgi:hypothetical protein
MVDESQAMSDLAYVKEVIQALPPDRKKEFFDHYVRHSNAKNQAKTVRPSTPEPTVASKEFQKRPLNSPLTPKRNKKDNKVLFTIYYYYLLPQSYINL